MDSILLSTPWDLHDVESGNFLLDDTNPICTISGSCSPRIVAPIDLEPRYGPKRKFLPKVSFPFRWDGQICTAFQLPTDSRPNKSVHDFSVNIFLSEKIHEITQIDIIGRPSGRHESDLGRRVESFIEWQIHCFRELVNDESSLNDLEEKSRNIVRRSWATVRKTWVNLDKSEAIMSLIVKLAQDKDLLRIFNTIVQRPRRILLRYRENTKLSRIQEFDSACIRDYARQPGRTPAEKAGPRQVLLAVQRKDSMDTLENRVFSWVINGMLERAMGYVATNQHHLQVGSNRVRTVNSCNRKCKEWLLSENIQSISFDQLQHPIQPNYSLQMDERYRHVYSTYRELLREKKALDDAWEWQRILWAESARQLVGCALTEFFKEEHTSTPYYRLESENGIWTESPVCPGPFETSKGTCIVIDSRDVQTNLKTWVESPPFEFAPYLGNLGCDQALFWPSTKTLLIIWFIYWTGESKQILPLINKAGEALRLFSSDVRRYTRKPYNFLGLLLITDHQAADTAPDVDIETWPSERELEMVGIRIPFAIDQTDSEEFRKLIENFKAGIHLVLEKAT
ncbi:MAG: DUF2357 domain-containing protein [Sedimentisphaerales bacterium]|nr:DUF2357 domain-containing protein [Sedimentisphaerales bacterium]